MKLRRSALLALLFLIGDGALPSRARAVLDIKDRGPVLNAGRMSLRVTNAGILGNAFYNAGLSSDPSLEFPSHSGVELLNYASLWVGASTDRDGNRVSGGPLLEWRPTPDPEDRVRSIWQDALGTRSLVDDDGDGRLDEEILNGLDDDGDGDIDEDLRVTSQQMLAADYVDDRPEGLYYIYEGSESHRPLGLSVHQEVYGWAVPGYENIAGLQFRITNHGTEVLRDLYVGLFTDLDVRRVDDRSGHLNDLPYQSNFWTTFSDGCIRRPERSVPVLAERPTASSAAATVPEPVSDRHGHASGNAAEAEGGDIISIEMIADRSQVRPGETLSYKFVLRNLIYYALLFPVCVEDEIPPGFRYVPGSARLDGGVIPDPVGRPLLFSFDGFAGASDLNGNGSIDPGEPGYRTLTFQVAVESGAGVGRYFSTAAACTGSVLRKEVSDRVQVGVDVVTAASTFPLITVVPLDHTVDPLALIPPAQAYARAPAQVGFRATMYERNETPGTGGVPPSDVDRYAALAGRYPVSTGEKPGDYVVLVSCGPFASLAPGQSIDFAAALVAAEHADDLNDEVASAMYLYNGTTANLLPDGADGRSGVGGHEVCLEAPEGVTFTWDPNCPNRFGDNPPPPAPRLYTHGDCIWTDADCRACTGSGGRETVLRWLDPGTVTPAPDLRVVPLDHAIRVEWNNRPEALLAAGLSGTSATQFVGYNVYKLEDWRRRVSLLPPNESWTMIASLGPDADRGQIPLAAVTDSSVGPQKILYRQRVYPPGRYQLTDSLVKNGFDYVYAVSTVSEIRAVDGRVLSRLESPLPVSFGDRVSPQAASRERAGGVWVVPNPFRAAAGWDRPAVLGDALTHHIDFMGLPRARCTIKIWTVAGDLVALLDHDGSQGDGQAGWDLVSRNGQDIESGIYLFTVDSSLGQQIGRFVVIR